MYPQRHCKRTEKETRPSISEMSLLKRKWNTEASSDSKKMNN